ncbi:MAG: 23S rRNA (pseudouridine(1915)-N(3))-methyltransferase RlmH [Acetivibrionales bacterium]|mgnify:CR=1 FL=1|jgi:23S rRNA (pseudouridine1915-N3)-methyltransferase|nr:23S rRNA (pseudouridine(1915)-N(3))-methyltransferase RlmH [Clostridiaceae bacterium]
MTIKIICVGKLKEAYLKDAQKEYLKRLSRFCKADVIEVDEEKVQESASPAQEEKARQKEAERIMKAIGKNSTTIALALDGKELDSVGFSGEIHSLMLGGKSDLAFIIGSSTGLDQSILKNADFKFCMSKLTFPHQLARIILLEQIYRAFKILNNETYHK